MLPTRKTQQAGLSRSGGATRDARVHTSAHATQTHTRHSGERAAHLAARVHTSAHATQTHTRHAPRCITPHIHALRNEYFTEPVCRHAAPARPSTWQGVPLRSHAHPTRLLRSTVAPAPLLISSNRHARGSHPRRLSAGSLGRTHPPAAPLRVGVQRRNVGRPATVLCACEIKTSGKTRFVVSPTSLAYSRDGEQDRLAAQACNRELAAFEHHTTSSYCYLTYPPLDSCAVELLFIGWRPCGGKDSFDTNVPLEWPAVS